MSSNTALVTGATGFLGRQVVKAFAFHDWTVKGTGYTRADGVDILKVDLSNAAEVEKVLDQQKCVAALLCKPSNNYKLTSSITINRTQIPSQTDRR